MINTLRFFSDLLFAEMTSLVVKHVSFGAKTLATALWTGKGPLISVDPLMNLQILFLAEAFVAAWKFALKGLRPVVKVHVCVKPYSPSKYLVATFEGAFENLVLAALNGV